VKGDAVKQFLTDEEMGYAPDALTDEEMGYAAPPDAPDALTDEEMGYAPDALTDEEMGYAAPPDAQDALTDEEMGYAPDALTDEEMGIMPEPSALRKAGTMLLDIPRGLARSVPQTGAMIYDTLAMIAPGETPGLANPGGRGMAGALAKTADYARPDGDEWYAPKSRGWWAVPGEAFSSLGTRWMATAAKVPAALPLLYGASRAQEIFRDLRDRATRDGTPFRPFAARAQAGIGGALEGGLEMLATQFGAAKALRDAARKGGQRAAVEAARQTATGLRAWAKEIATEAGTEAIQEGGADIQNRLLGIAEYIDGRPERLAEIDWKAVAERAAMGAAAGALAAGVAGGLRSAVQRTGRPGDAAAPADPDTAPPADPAAETAVPAEPAAEPVPAVPADPAVPTVPAEPVAEPVPAPHPQPSPSPLAAQAAPPRPRPAPKRRVRTASDRLWQSNPIAAAVIELGGIRASGEDTAGLPLVFRTSSETADAPDQMLAELQSMFPATATWTVDDLIGALQGRSYKLDAAPHVDPQERAWLKTAQPMQPENLEEGMLLAVRGVPYRVQGMDAEGAVLARADGQPGDSVRVAPGGLFYIDKGSLAHPDGTGADPAAVRSPQMLDAAEAERMRRDAEARREAEELGLPLDDAPAPDDAATAPDDDEDLPFRKEVQPAAAVKTKGPMWIVSDSDVSLYEEGAPLNSLPVIDRAKRVDPAPARPQSLTAPQPSPLPAEPEAPRGVTVLRGYQEPAAPLPADDPRYSRFPVELPELVQLATDLMGGRTPRVVKKVRGRENALGAVIFRGGRAEGMLLKAANYQLIEQREALEILERARAAFPADPAAAEAQAARETEALLKERMKRQPALAAAVIAHEIGHIADRMPRAGMPRSKKGLNLLGRIAGMMDYARTILADDPRGRTLSTKELNALRHRVMKESRARENAADLWRALVNEWAGLLRAHPEYRGVVSEHELMATLEYVRDSYPVLMEWWNLSDARERMEYVRRALESFTRPADQRQARNQGGRFWFRHVFAQELEASRQLHLETMRREMGRLAAWWSTGDESTLPEYFKRDSELYAECWGAYLNNPAATKARAPQFFKALEAYMERRPQLRDLLEQLHATAARGRGDVLAERDARQREMLGEERQRRQQRVYDRANKSAGRRTALDAARFFGLGQSDPLRAVARTLDAIGATKTADRVLAAADRMENVRGLEELFKTMNLEVARILDKADLTITDFDVWALNDMISRSPAYRDKAAPGGMHPAAAREQLAWLEKRMGPAKTAALRRAVAASQRIWNERVISILEELGGYSPDTINYLKSNPVYFTLQVGMDEADLKAWEKALASGNPEQVNAAIMQSIGRLGMGQGYDGEIHARTGTHRPAVSLFGASLIKGQALIRAAVRNDLARQTRALLEASGDPLFRLLDADERARGTAMQTVVTYREGGNDIRYLAPKYIGDFASGKNPMSAANRWMQASKIGVGTRFLKLCQTLFSLRFMLTQPWSDRKSWNQFMPGSRTPAGDIVRGDLRGLARLIPAGTWILPPWMFPKGSRERMMRDARRQARAYYRRGEISADILKLVERGMYDLGGAWQGVLTDRAASAARVMGGNPLAEIPREMARRQAAEMTRFTRALHKLGRATRFHWAQEQMWVENLANKLTGMQAIDERRPGWSERRKRDAVLMFAGNPNFARRAGADTYIDILAWSFYNPAKEGYRSAVEAARADPRGFMARTAIYNIAPKVLAFGASYGLLSQMLRRAIPHGDTPDEEERREAFLLAFERWESLFGRISSYFGRRHIAIPIVPVGQESALVITVPQSQSLAPLNATIDAVLDEAAELAGLKDPTSRAPESIMSALQADIPVIDAITGESRAMLFNLVAPALTLWWKEDRHNWYDSFYGRNLLDRQEEAVMRGGHFTSEALPVWGKVGKHAWNTAFGSAIFRWDITTPRADRENRTIAQRLLTATPLSGGWVRVVSGGISEQVQDVLAKPTAEQAAADIEARRAAAAAINNRGILTDADAARMQDDPHFAAAVSRFIARNEHYADLSVSDRQLLKRTLGERQILLESKLWKRLKQWERVHDRERAD
jgi:hypothetical protein